MFVVYLDAPLTRRKTYHLVYDPAGRCIYRSRYFAEIVEYLHNSEIITYKLITRDGPTMVVEWRADDQKDP